MEINGAPPPGANPKEEGLSSSVMGKDEFLNLLVAQMGNQDPLNPLDDKEFIAQLAQFSSLEQMMQVNERLAVLQVSQSAVANAQVVSLIGKHVEATSDTFTMGAGEPPPLSFDLGSNAETITAEIRDEDGTVVRSIELGSREAGNHSVDWDGRDEAGQPLPPGEYTITLVAEDQNGESVHATTRVSGLVTGVTFENGYPELEIGEVRVRPADVIEVEVAETPPASEETP